MMSDRVRITESLCMDLFGTEYFPNIIFFQKDIDDIPADTVVPAKINYTERTVEFVYHGKEYKYGFDDLKGITKRTMLSSSETAYSADVVMIKAFVYRFKENEKHVEEIKKLKEQKQTRRDASRRRRLKRW